MAALSSFTAPASSFFTGKKRFIKGNATSQTVNLIIKNIHPWQGWYSLTQHPGFDAQDDGIDLVAETKGGALAAIQCKCYADEYKVGKEDIKSFISAANLQTFPLRWFVATSKCTTTAEKLITRNGIRIIDFREYLDFKFEKNQSLNANRGFLFSDLKQYDKAEADFTKAIELKPELAKAYANHSFLFSKLEQYDKAEADYNKARELKHKLNAIRRVIYITIGVFVVIFFTLVM